MNKYSYTAGMSRVCCKISTHIHFSSKVLTVNYDNSSLLIILFCEQSTLCTFVLSLSYRRCFAAALPLLFSPYCPPVCMPAAGCQPIRPPGQLLQSLSLLQCHQHWQGSSRSHQLLPLLRDLCQEGRQHFDTLPVCGHLPGYCAGFSSHVATCWGATTTAASDHFTYRWVMGSWRGRSH